MAEAFAIIGLAANVAQFLEYCILFVSTTKNAYSSTRTAEGSNPERAVVAAEIKKHCWRITCFPTSSHANHSQDELSIGKIAEQCQSLADELLAVLDSLKPRPSPKFRSMEAIRVGLATLGKNKKIQELEERLNRLYRSLESSVGNVLQRNQHSRVMKVILELTSKNESLGISFPNKLVQVQEDITQAITASGLDLSALLNKLKDEGEKTAKVQKLLKSLMYSSIKFRERAIETAHDTTLEWMFDTPDTKFTEWLEEGDGVYWINGLPGSGKSTMMKFIYNSEKTTELLGTWAGSEELITASFFFWNSGDVMQKSQLGLLQSLIYQLLRTNIDLVPQQYLDRFEKEPWTESELMDLLQQISTAGNASTKFCFFIDGLDEFYGQESSLYDPSEQIIKIIRTLIQSINIKICVSSRPWPSFEKAFKMAPKFIVQDHTRNDIINFGQHMLSKNPQFLAVSQNDYRFELLARDIAYRAEGVWLWVFLVIRDLLRDLSIGEDFGVLERRLAAFPPHLDGYFKSMMDRIDHMHRMEAAQIFSLTLAASSYNELPLLAFQFMERVGDPAFPTSGVDPMAIGDVQVIERAWAHRLHARCGDLLKVQERYYICPRDSSLNPEEVPDRVIFQGVGFLHRTVADFIRENDAFLLQWIASDWNSLEVLAKLMLALLKVLYDGSFTKQELLLPQYYPTLGMVKQFLYYARELEEQRQTSSHELLATLEHTLASSGREYYILQMFEYTGVAAPILGLPASGEFEGFLALAAYFGLRHELEYRLKCVGSEQQRREFLLYFGLVGLGVWKSTDSWMSQYLGILELILEGGADPNQDFWLFARDEIYGECWTMWTVFLNTALVLTRDNMSVAKGVDTMVLDTLFEAAKLLIQYGVDPNPHMAVPTIYITYRFSENRRMTGTPVEEALTRLFGETRVGILLSMADEDTAMARRRHHQNQKSLRQAAPRQEWCMIPSLHVDQEHTSKFSKLKYFLHHGDGKKWAMEAGKR